MAMLLSYSAIALKRISSVPLGETAYIKGAASLWDLKLNVRAKRGVNAD
jgi:hypothetical protein